ncbi:MAG: hypothetical protein ACXWLH_02030 [Candidatus Saccharimonadales bacterium]
MIFREDSVWITEPERLHLLNQAGIHCVSHGERRIFEEALPGTTHFSKLFSEEDMCHFGGVFGDKEPIDALRELACNELREAGFDITELEDYPPTLDDQPNDTTDRFRLPIELTPELAMFYAVVCELFLGDGEEGKKSATIARANALQLVGIIPPRQRQSLLNEAPWGFGLIS